MKKYTDTELLETLLPMLNYSIITRADASNILDTVDFTILESNNFVSKSFVVALQNRINELAKKIKVAVTDIIMDEDEGIEMLNGEADGEGKEEVYDFDWNADADRDDLEDVEYDDDWEEC